MSLRELLAIFLLTDASRSRQKGWMSPETNMSCRRISMPSGNWCLLRGGARHVEFLEIFG